MNVVTQNARQIRGAASVLLLLCTVLPAEVFPSDLPDADPPKSGFSGNEVGIVNGSVLPEGAFPSLTALLSGRRVSVRLNQQHQLEGLFFGHGLNADFSGESVDCGDASAICTGSDDKVCLITPQSDSGLSPARQLANCSNAGGVGAVFWLPDNVLQRRDMFDGVPSIPAVFLNGQHSNRLLVEVMKSSPSMHVEVESRVAQSILCGATYLGGSWLLTAAHCVLELTRDGVRKVLPWEITASVGAHNLIEDTHLVQAVESIHVFEDVSDVTAIPADIALLKLTQPPAVSDRSTILTAKEDVEAAISIASRASVNEQSLRYADATVLGWGSTSVREPGEMIGFADTSPVPRSATVPLVPVRQCLDMWREYLGVSGVFTDIFGIDDSHICAFEPQLQRDTCQGDSGGPLLIEVQGQLELAGITSFGVGCGSTTGVPAVYTKVSEYTDWIEQTTGISFSNQTESLLIRANPSVAVNSMSVTSGGGILSVSSLLTMFAVFLVASIRGCRYHLISENRV